MLRGGLLSPGKGSPAVSTAEVPCCVMLVGPGLGVPDELHGSCRAAAPACVCLDGVTLNSQCARARPQGTPLLG